MIRSAVKHPDTINEAEELNVYETLETPEETTEEIATEEVQETETVSEEN